MLAYLAAYLQPGEGMETLAHAIVAVIVINALFSFFQEYKAERASAALHRLLPDRVKVRRGGKVAEVHAREVGGGEPSTVSPVQLRTYGTVPLALRQPEKSCGDEDPLPGGV